jgi:hypothetical protein
VCRVSCVVCRVSCVVCRVSCVVCRVSCRVSVCGREKHDTREERLGRGVIYLTMRLDRSASPELKLKKGLTEWKTNGSSIPWQTEREISKRERSVTCLGAM